MDLIGQGENLELWVINSNSSVKVTLWEKSIFIFKLSSQWVMQDWVCKIVLHQPFSLSSLLSFLSQLLPWTLSWYHVLHPNSSHSWLFPLQYHHSLPGRHCFLCTDFCVSTRIRWTCDSCNRIVPRYVCCYPKCLWQHSSDFRCHAYYCKDLAGCNVSDWCGPGR